MGRFFALLIGVVVGIILAGVGVGLLVPHLPGPWRSAGVVWASSTTLVAVCVLVAYVASRPPRD